jgi:hypothetical protein
MRAECCSTSTTRGPAPAAAKEARVCGFETMSAITPTGTGQFPTAAQSTVGIGTLVMRKSVTADATARPWTIVANGQTIYLFIESGDTTTPLATTTFCFGDFKSFKTADQYAVMIIGRTVEKMENPHDGFTILARSMALHGPVQHAEGSRPCAIRSTGPTGAPRGDGVAVP